MEDTFRQLSEQLEKEQKNRDDIRQVVQVINTNLARVKSELLRMHGDVTNLQKYTNEGLESLGSICKEINGISTLCSSETFYKYHDIFKNAVQTVVFIASLCEFINSDKIPDVGFFKELFEKNSADGLVLQFDMEDYLLGLCILPQELTRLCINSVTAGNYDMPARISKVLSELYSAFQLLNLKNDNLRRRFDSMKYELKKVEEVLYDVKIRNLSKS